MIITQLFITLFVFFAISRVVLRYVEGKLSTIALVGWIVVWSWIELVIWIPGITTVIAKTLGIGRGADLIIYGSIMTLFYLIFRLYVKLEDIERQITQIVQAVALKKVSKKSAAKSK